MSSSDSSSTSWVSRSSASIPTSSGQGPSLSPAPDCQDWAVLRPSAPPGPAALRPAPPPASTPLPALVLPDRGPVDGPLRRRDRGAGRQPVAPLPHFRAGPGPRWHAGAWAPRSATSRPAQLLARRLVSAGAFVPRPASAAFGARGRHRRRPRTGPAGAAEPVAGLARRPGVHRGRRRVGRCGRHRGDRRTPRRPLRRAGVQRRAVGRPQRGPGRGPERARRVRGLRLRAGRRVARPAARPLRGPAGGRRGTTHRAAQHPSHPAGALSRYETVAVVARPGSTRGAGPAGRARSPSCPSAAILVRADVA